MNAIQRILFIAGLAALTLGLLPGLFAQNDTAVAMPPTPQNSEYIALDACLTCHDVNWLDGSLIITPDGSEQVDEFYTNFTATRTINGS